MIESIMSATLSPLSYSAFIEANQITERQEYQLHGDEIDRTLQDLIHKYILNGFKNVLEIRDENHSQLLKLLHRRQVFSESVAVLQRNDLQDGLLKLEKPVDLIFSHRVYHRFQKGGPLRNYLQSVANSLTENGVYLVSDEFIPNYRDEEDRKIKMTIWHAAIITHALRNRIKDFAIEGARAFLDNLWPERGTETLKTVALLELIQTDVTAIDRYSRSGEFGTAMMLAGSLLGGLERIRNSTHFRKPADGGLVKEDYKVCDRVFREEVAGTGLKVTARTLVGQVDTIGGYSIYTLVKA